MQYALLALVAFALMGGRSSPPPPPQQNLIPPTQPGQQTGQVISDVKAGIEVGKDLVEWFKAFMSGVNSQP